MDLMELKRGLPIPQSSSPLKTQNPSLAPRHVAAQPALLVLPHVFPGGGHVFPSVPSPIPLAFLPVTALRICADIWSQSFRSSLIGPEPPSCYASHVLGAVLDSGVLSGVMTNENGQDPAFLSIRPDGFVSFPQVVWPPWRPPGMAL